MKKMLNLRAIQVLKGNDAVIAEILKALRKTRGNMRDACELLGVGKSSMYRLIKDIGAEAAVDELVQSLNAKVQGKVLTAPKAAAPAGPRNRVKRTAAG